jgi:hypothetical protein
VFPWGAAFMEETVSHQNKLPLLFLHLVAVPFGDVEGQVARSSHRSLEPVRFVFGGRRSVLLRATNMLAVIVVFVSCSWACGWWQAMMFLFFDCFGWSWRHWHLVTTGKIPSWRVMTHKYRGCIIVLSINKSVEPNEEQKVLTSSFDQGFTINTNKRVFRGIW